MMNCKICGHSVTVFSNARVLNKYSVKYYFCDTCRFVQTEDPYWLNEAYSEAIAVSDVGLVDRNKKFSKITRTVIRTFFDCNGKFLDYGGGVWLVCPAYAGLRTRFLPL